MGFFKSLTRIGKSILKKAVPGAALGIAGVDIATNLFSGGGGGGGGGNMPALPPTGAGGLSLPGMPGAPSTMGQRSIFKNDPNLIEALKPWAISKGNLKQYYRAPKGFVVMYDQVGDPYGLPKAIARAYLGWKPSRKPPISAGDWRAFQKSGSVIKKLQRIEAAARKHRLPAKRKGGAVKANYQILESGPGGIKIKGGK